MFRDRARCYWGSRTTRIAAGILRTVAFFRDLRFRAPVSSFMQISGFQGIGADGITAMVFTTNNIRNTLCVSTLKVPLNAQNTRLIVVHICCCNVNECIVKFEYQEDGVLYESQTSTRLADNDTGPIKVEIYSHGIAIEEMGKDGRVIPMESSEASPFNCLKTSRGSGTMPDPSTAFPFKTSPAVTRSLQLQKVPSCQSKSRERGDL